MPVCELCDGETFENRDGLFYCLECGTQSQNVREEMLAEKEFGQHGLVIQQKRKKGKQAFARTKGQAWLMCEAFQIIIKAQVQYLISLGVNPRLKDVVGQIWFAYLQKSGIAFCSDEEASLIWEGKFSAKRVPTRSLKKKQKKLDLNDELPELSSELGEETYYSGDDPMQTTKDTFRRDLGFAIDDDDDDDEDDEDAISTDEESVGSLPSTKKRRIKVLSIRTTLTLCYLGILWLDEPIFLSDLIRWAKEGSFPFFQVARLLPDYMKLGGSDSRILSAMFPPYRKRILADAVQIVKLLNIPDLSPKDLSVYTSRYIVDLHLPEIFHGFVRNLLNIFEPYKYYSRARVPHYEETAVAYILLAFKMCYGLDDKEYHSPESAEEPLHDPNTSHNTLPLFEDWASCVRQCRSKREACGVPWTDEEFRHTRDPRPYGSFCRTDIFGSWAVRDLELVEGRSSVGHMRRGIRQEYRESLAEIFSSLVEGGNSVDDQQQSTSFPYQCRHATKSNTCEQYRHCFDGDNIRRLSLDSLRQSSIGERTQDKQDENATNFQRYTRYLRRDVNGDTRHPSYDFLLRYLSSRIEATADEVEEILVKLEALMLTEPVEGIWQRFRKKVL